MCKGSGGTIVFSQGQNQHRVTRYVWGGQAGRPQNKYPIALSSCCLVSCRGLPLGKPNQKTYSELLTLSTQASGTGKAAEQAEKAGGASGGGKGSCPIHHVCHYFLIKRKPTSKSSNKEMHKVKISVLLWIPNAIPQGYSLIWTHPTNTQKE